MFEQFLLYFSSLNIIVNIVLVVIIIFLIKAIFAFLKLCDYPKSINVSSKQTDYDLYNKYSEDTYKTIKSNIENFDKNILTITTFLLGLSLIFIKDILGMEPPKNIDYIYSAWAYFLTSIAMTMTSFIVGWKENESAINIYYKYIIEQRKEYEDKKSIYAYILEYSTYLSIIFLFLGMIYLYIFVKLNFKGLN